MPSKMAMGSTGTVMRGLVSGVTRWRSATSSDDRQLPTLPPSVWGDDAEPAVTKACSRADNGLYECGHTGLKAARG